MQVAPRTATGQEPATLCTATGQEGDAWEDCSVADQDDDTDEEEPMEQPMNQSSRFCGLRLPWPAPYDHRLIEVVIGSTGHLQDF